MHDVPHTDGRFSDKKVGNQHHFVLSYVPTMPKRHCMENLHIHISLYKWAGGPGPSGRGGLCIGGGPLGRHEAGVRCEKWTWEDLAKVLDSVQLIFCHF